MGAAGEEPIWSRHGRQAALLVAVIAAFLAVATFLANEAVKEVITGRPTAPTPRRRARATGEIDIAGGNARLVGCWRRQPAGAACPEDRGATPGAHRTRAEAGRRPPTARIQDDKRTADRAN